MESKVQNKQTVLDLLKANGHQLRSFGVSDLRLFGSFRMDTATEDSDVDLLVDFDPSRKSFDNFMNLAFFLEDLMGRKVEVVTPQSLNKHIGKHIIRQAEHVSF